MKLETLPLLPLNHVVNRNQLRIGIRLLELSCMEEKDLGRVPRTLTRRRTDEQMVDSVRADDPPSAKLSLRRRISHALERTSRGQVLEAWIS